MKDYINSDEWCWQLVPMMWCDLRKLTPHLFFPQTHNLCLIMRKTSDKPLLRNILQIIWPVILNELILWWLRSHQKQEVTASGALGDRTPKYNILSWLGSWNNSNNNKKKTLGKNLGSLNKMWTLVNSNVPILSRQMYYTKEILIIGETLVEGKLWSIWECSTVFRIFL